MNAVVLARGQARRMREADAGAALDEAQQRAAAAGLKAMMPIDDETGTSRPFLDFVLSDLADAGCSRIGLVIGPEHDEIRRRYGDRTGCRRLSVDLLVQPFPRGTADAVLTAESWAAGAPFLVVNADNLYPPEALAALVRLAEPGLPVFRRDDLVRHSNIPAERVGAFALLDVGADGYLRAIVEKPGPEVMAAAGPDALVSMNCWRFDARIFDACRAVAPSPRGELELPLAVAVALGRGCPFRAVPASGAVLDLSRRSDVAAVARQLQGRDVRL